MQAGRNICPRCLKAVYAAEMAIGPERKSYHKLCLTCASCKTKLAPGTLQDHDGEPYCRNCHRRLFSPRDLRSANLPSADNSFSDVEAELQNDVSKNGVATEDPAANVQALVAADVTGNPPARASPRRSFGGPRVECPRCGKAVYQAEQVLAVGKKWHRGCLQCTSCRKRLDPHNLSDKDGETYCRPCYSKNHGPAGSGYALLGKAGG